LEDENFELKKEIELGN